MTYGEFEIHALPEGRFTVGLDKRFVPHDEGDALPPGTLFVSVCPFLVRTPSEVLLLDTGLGEWADGRGVDFLLDGLARHGVAREQVTKVLFSHLHFDHAGGAVFSVEGERRPTFPNAEYVVQRGELEAPYEAKSTQARALVIETLDAAGQLVTVAGDGFLTDAIEHVHTGGHTRDHQALRLHTGGRTAVFAGDVLAGPTQVLRRFLAKYDFDAKRAQAERSRIIAEAAEAGHLLLFYHSTGAPAAFVDEGPQSSHRIEPVGL